MSMFSHFTKTSRICKKGPCTDVVKELEMDASVVTHRFWEGVVVLPLV